MNKKICKLCNGTYFINNEPCPHCNKGTLSPKQPILKTIRDMWKAFKYWYLPW